MCNMGSKKSRFIKNQVAKWILSDLGLKTPLNKIPLLGDILNAILLKAIPWKCMKMNLY